MNVSFEVQPTASSEGAIITSTHSGGDGGFSGDDSTIGIRNVGSPGYVMAPSPSTPKKSHMSPVVGVESALTPPLVRQMIVAEEQDSDNENESDDHLPNHNTDDEDDHDSIPGPIDMSRRTSAGYKRQQQQQQQQQHDRSSSSAATNELDLSRTDNYRRGAGVLASVTDLRIHPDEFARGCKLLQQAALGNLEEIKTMLIENPRHVHFRDYDRRTALHVAASEGHLEICRVLLQNGARINRSDRWGGSALDDAHRHRHQAVIDYLRRHGATTGSANQVTNLITAAAEGDYDEVRSLLELFPAGSESIVDAGDYDGRTALHLSSGEGHGEIVQLLLESGANPNAEDRWGSRPLDDARHSKNKEIMKLLEKYGAEYGIRHNKSSSERGMETSGSRHTVKSGNDSVINGPLNDSTSNRFQNDNLKIDFSELEMIDRIGSGAFGEIFKCRWRGTLVAAKCIKSARIRKEWIKKEAMNRINKGEDVDDAIDMMDQADLTDSNGKDAALADFRQEISVLKSLRHPHIVLLLAYSTTKDHEVMISELMKCSLLDVFKAHLVNGTKMKKKNQIVYATQLAQGMLYLHTCRPPIIHRDLKPANLLIDFSGVLKVADFGLSKVRPTPKKGTMNAADGTENHHDTFIMTGETGSYRFMAPEVYRHEAYSETVDIYSYAMILYYLLDGKPPWPYLNGLVAVRKAAEEGDRPPIPRHWDQRLQALLQECWDETAASRPSFSRVLRVLNDYSRDVFHADSDTMPSTSFRDSSGARCNCAIM